MGEINLTEDLCVLRIGLISQNIFLHQDVFRFYRVLLCRPKFFNDLQVFTPFRFGLRGFTSSSFEIVMHTDESFNVMPCFFWKMILQLPEISATCFLNCFEYWSGAAVVSSDRQQPVTLKHLVQNLKVLGGCMSALRSVRSFVLALVYLQSHPAGCYRHELPESH